MEINKDDINIKGCGFIFTEHNKINNYINKDNKLFNFENSKDNNNNIINTSSKINDKCKNLIFNMIVNSSKNDLNKDNKFKDELFPIIYSQKDVFLKKLNEKRKINTNKKVFNFNISSININNNDKDIIDVNNKNLDRFTHLTNETNNMFTIPAFKPISYPSGALEDNLGIECINIIKKLKIPYYWEDRYRLNKLYLEEFFVIWKYIDIIKEFLSTKKFLAFKYDNIGDKDNVYTVGLFKNMKIKLVNGDTYISIEEFYDSKEFFTQDSLNIYNLDLNKDPLNKYFDLVLIRCAYMYYYNNNKRNIFPTCCLFCKKIIACDYVRKHTDDESDKNKRLTKSNANELFYKLKLNLHMFENNLYNIDMILKKLEYKNKINKFLQAFFQFVNSDEDIILESIQTYYSKKAYNINKQQYTLVDFIHWLVGTLLED